MKNESEGLLARVDESVPATAVDRGLARAVLATLVVGSYTALGFAFGLSANAYLLLGIPITIAFQLFVAHRPLRALWLRSVPPVTLTPWAMSAVVVVAIAPAIIAISGVRDGDAVLAMYGLAGMVGATGVVYAVRAGNEHTVRSALRAALINGFILVGVMVVFRLTSGGFTGNTGAAVATAFISVATYLPAVFVMEEVLFRGALDPYLAGPVPGGDTASAVFGSVLWGVWHVPVMSVDLGILTIPYLVVVHTALGFVLVTAWRRSGNLAAPGVAHAVADALRNAVGVL